VVIQSGDEVAGAGSWKKGVKGTGKGNDACSDIIIVYVLRIVGANGDISAFLL